jgi:hypothetical protein
MSDLNYNMGRDNKYHRYIEDPTIKMVNQEIKSKLNLEKPPIFPKIKTKHTTNLDKKSL